MVSLGAGGLGVPVPGIRLVQDVLPSLPWRWSGSVQHQGLKVLHPSLYVLYALGQVISFAGLDFHGSKLIGEEQ